ncbi:mandelate racemase/muconate lactonizing enzyme family protein [Neptunicella sp.]|uniref:mandelate racemase/muconate lactonizing enzyme family protein n=1 Tax=Neptunicella sp. TaxID=2125986 RepID=UPI003F690E4F
MQISKIEISHLNVALHHPIRTPLGAIDAARNVVVKVCTDSGYVGWGEASPFAPITGDSQDSNYIAAQQLAKLIIGKNPLAIAARMAQINHFTLGDPSIRSAFDMALYDIAAKAAGLPLYQFLGGEARALRTDLTIGMQDSVEQTVQQAQAILDAGFDAIKLKVGRDGLEDVAHVAAVRELAGANVAIKIDSNQGWDYPTAVANLKAMASLNLQYSEQPLAAWDHAGLARLRDKVDLPICADESVFNHHDALKLIKLDAVDYLNIKLGKAGGIQTGMKINTIAEAAKIKCMIGCFGESRLGLSAAAHLAMARPNITFLDLDSAYHFKMNPVKGGLVYDEKTGGVIHLPDAPGHGAEIDETATENHISIEL